MLCWIYNVDLFDGTKKVSSWSAIPLSYWECLHLSHLLPQICFFDTTKMI